MNSRRANQFLLSLIILLVPYTGLLAQMDQSTIEISKKGNSNIQCQSAAGYFNQSLPVCDSGQLDNYCLTMSDSMPYSPHEWPGCQGVTLHNPHWVNFIAGSNEMVIEVVISNCENNNGAQLAIYRLPKDMNYGPDQPPIDPSPNLIGPPVSGCYYSENPQQGAIKFSTSTHPGQLFGLLIDGWNGDLCQVEINVIKGATVPSIQEYINDTISYPKGNYGFNSDTVCQGSQAVPFYLNDPVDGASSYIWTLNGNRIDPDNVNGYLAKISFEEEGPAEVCVQATNHCDTTAPLCVNVPVRVLDIVETIDTICEGQAYDWMLKNDNWMGEYGPFDFFEGDTQLHSFYYQESDHCRINTELELFVKNVNNEAPTALDTFAGFTELPILIMDTLIDNPVEELIIVDSAEPGSDNCDQFYKLDMVVLGGKFFIDMQCQISGGARFSFDGFNDRQFYSDWSDQLAFMEQHQDFEIEFEWRANGAPDILGKSKVLMLEHDQLDRLADNGVGTMNLQLLILYKGDTMYQIEAPPMEYNMENQFTPEFKEIHVLGDTLLIWPDSSMNYQWIICNDNYNIIEGATKQHYLPAGSGSYGVIIDNGFCRDTSDCYFFSIQSSNDDLREDELTIFPNPVVDQFTIKNSTSQYDNTNYMIHSVSGKLVAQGVVKRDQYIDVKSLAKGVYYFTFNQRSYKLVKL